MVRGERRVQMHALPGSSTRSGRVRPEFAKYEAMHVKIADVLSAFVLFDCAAPFIRLLAYRR